MNCMNDECEDVWFQKLELAFVFLQPRRVVTDEADCLGSR